MNRFWWYITLMSGLLLISALTYVTQITLFHKEQDTFFYMMQDFAFVPVQVVFVTLVLDRLLKKQEKQSLLKKLNMLIGIFFHELGNELLAFIKQGTVNHSEISSRLKIAQNWSERDFESMLLFFRNFNYHVSLSSGLLKDLKGILTREKDSIRDMLKNPNLLEHESFTDLLWAVFHLTDELLHRKNLEGLPEADMKHLEGDLRRVYLLLVLEWVRYMKHLKMEYPYLYSIAVRTNPLNETADITVL